MPLCIKNKEMDPQKNYQRNNSRGVIRQKSQPLGVKKYFANASPPKWPLDWLQQLIHFGTLTWGVWGAYQAANNLLWYIHYITLHTLVRQFSRALSIGNDAMLLRKDGVLAYIRCTGYNKQKTYQVDSNLVPTEWVKRRELFLPWWHHHDK